MGVLKGLNLDWCAIIGLKTYKTKSNLGGHGMKYFEAVDALALEQREFGRWSQNSEF